MISIKEVADYFFEKINKNFTEKEKQTIIKYLEKKEKKEFKNIGFGLNEPVFEIIIGTKGSGKTFKINTNKNFYKNFLIVDTDIYRKELNQTESRIPSAVKDIIVLYGIINGSNIVLQTVEWDDKREFFLFLSKYRKDVFKNFLYNKKSCYQNKITVMATNPVISQFSAVYRYFIENEKYYINPYKDRNLDKKTMSDINSLLLKVKNGTHIKPYVSENKYCFEIKNIPLYSVINNITFINRNEIIKTFYPVKDKKLIKEMFPFFYKASLYKEMNINSIYPEYLKIIEALNYAQKNKNEDIKKDSLMYLSYISYSIAVYIEEKKLLNRKDLKNLYNQLEKIKEEPNFKIFKKVKIRNTNMFEIIENFLKEKSETKTIRKKVNISN
jgi:hypothetical protein